MRGIVFDVFGTMFQISALGDRLAEAGFPAHTLKLWFARALRDGFAASLAERFVPFRETAMAALQSLAAELELDPGASAIERVLDGFAELPAWPDLKPALELARDRGAVVVTLGNGSSGTARRLLDHAGCASLVRECLSIDDVHRWKPRAEPYAHALKFVGGEAALIAAHSWDVQGAMHAGLRGVWLRRIEKRFPQTMGAPDASCETLEDCVRAALS